MSQLQENPTVEQVKDFLLSVMDDADKRKSKVNPIFTKERVWNIFMDSVIDKEDSEQYKVPMGVKRINKEFGGGQ